MGCWRVNGWSTASAVHFCTPLVNESPFKGGTKTGPSTAQAVSGMTRKRLEIWTPEGVLHPNTQMPTDRIIGIDLGTTNSLVAYMEKDRPVVIPGEDGLNLVPSVVALDENDQIVVGNAARKYLIETPERAVYSVKRLMGRGVEDVQEELKLFPFRLADDLAPGEVLRIKLGEQDIHAAGDFGLHSAPAQAQRRTIFRSAGHQGGHHRARVFQRRTAPGHERRGPHCRPRSAAPGERADGGVAGLRSR